MASVQPQILCKAESTRAPRLFLASEPSLRWKGKCFWSYCLLTMPVEFVIACCWCCCTSHLGQMCLALEASLLTFSKVKLRFLVSSWHSLLGRARRRVAWSRQPQLSALLYPLSAARSSSLPVPLRGGPWEITGWVCSALSAMLGMRISLCGWTTCILFFSLAK